MNIKHFLVLSLLSIGVLATVSCPSGSPPPPSNNSAANAPPKTNSNTDTANISKPTNMSNNTNNQPPLVDSDALSNALKIQLKKDKEDVLTPAQWEADKWLDMPIGRFYKNLDKLVGNAVCDVTDALLKPHNKRMRKNAALSLRNKVKFDKKCKDAVEEMLTVALDNESIEPIP